MRASIYTGIPTTDFREVPKRLMISSSPQITQNPRFGTAMSPPAKRARRVFLSVIRIQDPLDTVDDAVLRHDVETGDLTNSVDGDAFRRDPYLQGFFG